MAELNSRWRSLLRSSHFTLLILTLAYSCNVFDRTILGILLEPIRREYALSDSELGLLSGLAFAVFFAIAGLPLGVLADRVNRRNMLAACLAVWSGMTFVCGLTHTFLQLLLARIGVGIGEAGGGPAATSMIADLYPPQRRATAISVFYLASPIGAFLSLAAGGRIAAQYGWRAAFFFGGAPGILLAGAMLLLVKEPLRGLVRRSGGPLASANSLPRQSLPTTLRFIRSQRSLVYIVAGMTLHIFVLSAVGTWIASFFVRIHHVGLADIGPLLGLIIGGGGLVGTLAGGMIVDRLARHDERWRTWTLALASALCVPFLIATLLLTNTYASLGMFACSYTVGALWYGPAFALCQSLVGARMRGTIAAVTYLTSNLIGYGLGAQLVGVLSDGFAHRVGPESLRYALLVSCSAGLLAAASFFRATKDLRRNVMTAEGA